MGHLEDFKVQMHIYTNSFPLPFQALAGAVPRDGKEGGGGGGGGGDGRGGSHQEVTLELDSQMCRLTSGICAIGM